MPRQPKKLVESISIHLLKNDVTLASSAIVEGKNVHVLKAAREILTGGELYYRAPPATPVAWQHFLRPAFGSELDELRSQHVSAVLIFPAGGRLFAVTFGYGRSLLSESALEPDFGLRTALNLCEPSTLRAVDFRTIEERTRVGRIQLSEEGSVGAFRIDTETDLLRGLEGRSNDPSVCERLGARWSSLTIAARLESRDLPALAVSLLKSFRRRSLPQDFEWIDNVRRVTDPSLVSRLDAELELRLDNGQHAGIRLAIPEISGTSLDLIARFFKPNGIDFDANITTYLRGRPRDTSSTIQSAKRNHHVVLVDSASNTERQSVPVYRCIVTEFEFNQYLYLLADGEWFRLNRDFVAEVDHALTHLEQIPHDLPAWQPGEHEGHWNVRACDRWDAAALLDKSNIQHGSSHSKVEPADFLTNQRVLAHVKRRDKNSSGLSHLFAQGAVSAELLAQDRDFRRKVAAALPRSHRTLANELRQMSFDPRRWTVGYVLLGAPPATPALGLPFFSKVNLRKHAKRLAAMQFRIGLIGV